jgi:type I restriction-modification system DNA methylase subunit
MNNFQFTHEKSKKDRGIDAHVSTPPDLAQLLTKLLEIDKAEGKLIYDCCFGTGALSQYVNTTKNVLIGDDKELTYLEQGQSNNPKAILFHHDTLVCSKMPCYQHLISLY